MTLSPERLLTRAYTTPKFRVSSYFGTDIARGGGQNRPFCRARNSQTLSKARVKELEVSHIHWYTNMIVSQLPLVLMFCRRIRFVMHGYSFLSFILDSKVWRYRLPMDIAKDIGLKVWKKHIWPVCGLTSHQMRWKRVKKGRSRLSYMWCRLLITAQR